VIKDFEAERCDCNVLHEDVVKKVKLKMPQYTDMNDLAELFKIFGDTTRINILSALFEEEMCVCDIACNTVNSLDTIFNDISTETSYYNC